VALSESDAQAWREGKVSRERGGGARWGASPFLVAEGGKGWLRRSGVNGMNRLAL
jgi:hypothetical protein